MQVGLKVMLEGSELSRLMNIALAVALNPTPEMGRDSFVFPALN